MEHLRKVATMGKMLPYHELIMEYRYILRVHSNVENLSFDDDEQ